MGPENNHLLVDTNLPFQPLFARVYVNLLKGNTGWIESNHFCSMQYRAIKLSHFSALPGEPGDVLSEASVSKDS